MIFEPSADGIDLVVDGAWTDVHRDAILAGHADGLVLNYARGFVGADLAFLRGLPVRRLDLIVRHLADVSPIESLGATLRVLDLDAAPGSRIDLAALPVLTSLAAPWEAVRGSLSAARTLTDVYLGGFDGADLAAFGALPALRRLTLKERPALRTLRGLESTQRLEMLGVHRATRLSDLRGLGAPEFEDLVALAVPWSRALRNLVGVDACTGLRRLDASESGGIETLAPVRGLVGLEMLHLHGSTVIVDGDLSPLLDLPHLDDLRIMDRAAYSPRLADVRTAMAKRSR